MGVVVRLAVGSTGEIGSIKITQYYTLKTRMLPADEHLQVDFEMILTLARWLIIYVNYETESPFIMDYEHTT